jgi:hypothetical protein
MTVPGDDPGRLGASDSLVADELCPGLRERGGDALVPAACMGCVVAVDVDFAGPGLGGETHQLAGGIAAPEMERAPIARRRPPSSPREASR